MDDWDAGLRNAVNALIPEVEGKPVVNTGFYDGGVYICRRIRGRHTREDRFNGECEWIDPEELRPGELTDEILRFESRFQLRTEPDPAPDPAGEMGSRVRSTSRGAGRRAVSLGGGQRRRCETVPTYARWESTSRVVGGGG